MHEWIEFPIMIAMLVATLCAFLLNGILTPCIILLCKKHRWYDNVSPRKMHDDNVPRLGGIGIFISVMVTATVYIVFFSPEDYRNTLPVCIAGCIVFVEGLLDDFYNLRARTKLVIQCLAAFVVAVGPLYFTHVLGITVHPFIGRFITFWWVLSLVNAYNLIDGLDMLCGGLSLLTLLTLAFLFLFYGKDASVLCFIFCGAILAFLLFNNPPAKIFLGDGGSQFLGFAIAVLPLFSSFGMGIFDNMKIIVMLLLTAIPVTDVFAAIWRRVRDKRSFFSADRAHVHHKLINIGFSKTVTVFCLLALQVLICLSVLGLLFMRGRRQSAVLLFVALTFVWLFFIAVHYINRTVNIRLRGHLDAAPQEEH